MSRNNYSDKTKTAVMAALLEGQSAAQVAEDYNIPVGTIHSWKNRQENANAEDYARIASEKRERIADLIIELLSSHLEAATSIIKAVADDEEYIKNQSASEVAVLLGVINDKAFRMLEALGRAEDRSTED